MKIKYVIWLLPIVLVFSSLTFSQQTTQENVVQPDVQSPVSPEVKKEEIATAALKAASFNNGVSTFVNSKVKFELVSKDNVATDKILYKIDAGNELEYKEPFAIYEEGKHVISYYAVDKVGNKEDSKAFKVIVDNTPPVINVSVSAPVIKSGEKLYASKNFTFVIEAKDALSGVQSVEYSIDKNNYQPYLTPFTIPVEGDINLSIKAMDNVTNYTEKYTMVAKDENGNPINLTDGNVSIFVDNKAPVVEIKPDKELLDKNGRKVATADYSYTISASDAESGLSSILYRLDGKGEFKTYTTAIKFDTNGEHMIEAKAVDKVGNVSPVAVLSVFVDIIAPDTTIKAIE
ncbi:MAG: Ig-like domain-containing protein [Spirochaetota bacterium]